MSQAKRSSSTGASPQHVQAHSVSGGTTIRIIWTQVPNVTLSPRPQAGMTAVSGWRDCGNEEFAFETTAGGENPPAEVAWSDF